MHGSAAVPGGYLAARNPPLVRRLPGRPDLLELQARWPARYPFLLESACGASPLGEFDLLFGHPGETLALDADWRLEGPGSAAAAGDFLSAFDAWWASSGPGAGPEADAARLPFRGGWFLFLAYELAQQIEPRLRLPADAGFPVAMAVRIPVALIHSHRTGETVAVAEAGAAGLLDAIADDVAGLAARHATADGPPGGVLAVAEEPPERFHRAVGTVLEHIRRGDVYQANISRQWRGEMPPGTRPWDVYRRLRRANPAPFAGLALLGPDACVLSSSPERLLRVQAGRVETRPIAGTRPRAALEASDTGLRRDLLASAKERAEHVMLIDLERNDLGRICRPGTIRVDDFMTLESYAHVHHIVSGISGTLRAGTRPGQVLRAVFPGGTITGCPKVRCIGIIRDVENRPRGPYTGAMGYVNHDGSCDFNILIRTIAVQAGRVSFSAGSGIVADSDPARELEETRAKARGMLLALQA